MAGRWFVLHIFYMEKREPARVFLEIRDRVLTGMCDPETIHLELHQLRIQRVQKILILANASGGTNVLWLTEWLTSELDLRPGMKVLDLGCGRASSSIFLQEFGV